MIQGSVTDLLLQSWVGWFIKKSCDLLVYPSLIVIFCDG